MTGTLERASNGFTYIDHGLLIGPLRMELQRVGLRRFWVYCWDDPGVRDRVKAEVNAVVDYDNYRRRG